MVEAEMQPKLLPSPNPKKLLFTHCLPTHTAVMADQDQVESIYQPKDAIGGTIKATAITGTAGLFVSTIQNTLTRQNVGAMGVFTRTGSTIAVFGRPHYIRLGGREAWDGALADA